MALSLTLPASAANEDVALTDAQIASAVTAAAGALVDADEDATVKANKTLIEAIAEDANTPEEVANFFSKFIFVEESQVEAVSQKIADDCKYRITTIEDGKKTVYVAVDLRICKEIFDARVFLNATKKIFDKCEELAIIDGKDANPDNYKLMSYDHLAGELALHMIIADVTNDLGATKGNGILRDLYDRAVVSELNIDEDRLAPALIEFIGQSVIFFLQTFFKTFSKL